MHPMLNVAILAARSASRILMRYMDRLDTLDVTQKGRNDLVSQVDQLAEQDIIQTIRKHYPDHAILGEETGQSTDKSDFCWIIDPLDGTANYLHGFPQFAISIGLKHKDKLLVGAIYDPLLQELYTASSGNGAQLNDRRIRVSQTKDFSRALIGTGFPFRKHELLPCYFDIFTHLYPQISDIRRAGSAALDLAYVAAGRLDGYWEFGLGPWDMLPACYSFEKQVAS